MNSNTIYRVSVGGKDHYFGSVAAIFDKFTPEELGVAKQTLWNYGLAKGRTYTNKICTISQGEIYRKKRQE